MMCVYNLNIRTIKINERGEIKMKSISLRTKIITGLISGGVLLSSVSLTFAATTKTLPTSGKAPLRNELRQSKGNLETNLAKLVADKTITQNQADKIKDAITKVEATRKADFEKIRAMTEEERKTYMDSNKISYINPLKAIVDDGTITQAQADKVGFGGIGKHGGLDGKVPFTNKFTQPKGNLEDTLKLGVSSNIITQTESDKILTYHSSKIDSTVKKEKNTTERPDFFKELVDKGILTQAKADALKASEEAQRDAKRQQEVETNLTKLVTDKTITQNQADKIKDAMIKAEATRKAEIEKVKSMTEAERKTYMDSNKANHINPLKSLVDNGTITQAQADKIGLGRFGTDNHNGADKHMKGLKAVTK
jgi:Spy/CpxP family protein refolding chaperone